MKNVIVVLSTLILCVAALAAEEPAAKPKPGDMVLIPGGVFTMGHPANDDMPQHTVRVSSFWIDAFEVTNAEYHRFCEATDHPLPVFWGLDRFRASLDYPDHPVIGVSNSSARKYAEWAGKRLPTEAEWEYAARGGLEGLRFDTSDELTIDDANYKKTGNDGPVAVGSYRPNGYGLYDMIGNAREHVVDFWSEFDGDPENVLENPKGPLDGRWRVVRGGGWFSGAMCNGVTTRNVLAATWSDFNVGFRCAKDTKKTD